MGICCRSKEIVYSNNMSDLPIVSMERHEKNTNIPNNRINNSCIYRKNDSFNRKKNHFPKKILNCVQLYLENLTFRICCYIYL